MKPTKLLAIAVILACSGVAKAQSYNDWRTNGLNWQLIFADEFDPPSLNANNWAQSRFVWVTG